RAVVFRLLLSPYEVLKLRHGLQPLDQWLGREGIKLLDPHDLDAEVAGFVPRFHQLVTELARAKDDAAGLAFRRRVEVGDDPAEMALAGEIGSSRHREPVAKQRLGRHQHQRLAEAAPHLAPENVEIIRRRRAIRDLEIVLGAELQIALEPRRAVLGALPLEAMREQHDEAARAQPLGFTRGDELVDDALGAIGEVAELRFPQHEAAGVGERIAIFEPQDAELGKRTVADFEAALADVTQRDIFVAGLLIDPHGVALAEGAPAAVLARKTHAAGFGDETSERERFGGRPVAPFAAVEHRLFRIEDALQRAVDVEAFGNGRQNLAETLQLFFADGGLNISPAEHRFIGLGQAGPPSFEPVRLVGEVRVGGLKFLLEMGDIVRRRPVDPRLVDHALAEQPLTVELADRRMLLDRGVHLRLGEARLVALVVAEAPIAPHVDDHVAVERLPELGRELAAEGHGFGIVAVDVEDRRLDAFRHVRRIRRGAAELRAGGETDLVIDDEMDGPAGSV